MSSRGSTSENNQENQPTNSKYPASLKSPFSSPASSPVSITSIVQNKMRRMLLNHRGADIHVETRQGSQHIAEGTPNQDICFALVRNGNRSVKRVITAGVFDGHGNEGHIASKTACMQMERSIDAYIFNDSTSEISNSLSKILTTSFIETSHVVNGSNAALNSGSTASILLIKENQLCIGWVGDSLALIVADANKTNGYRTGIRYMTKMHRVSNEDELKRIKQANGQVQDGYVVDATAKNGIAVTRTLGDIDMHQYGCISDPQIARMSLQKHDAVIIMASDGLWDTPGITEQLILQITGDKKGRTAKRICAQLMQAVEEARGPTDDCTITCIVLR